MIPIQENETLCNHAEAMDSATVEPTLYAFCYDLFC